MRLLLSVFLILVTLSGICSEVEQVQKEYDPSSPEFRAFWVTRFSWASEDPERTRTNIINIFEGLEKTNVNAVLFQVRGCAEALYRSELEPWSFLLGRKDPGFDPLKLAIDEAHKRGIQFHAYINPMPLYPGRPELPKKEEVPDHMFFKHGPDSEESWVCMDENGEIADARRNEYYYFSAGIPQVHEYLRTVILDIVKRYDVDGIHLDRIRYPGPRYSHDPISKSRFYGRGNPNRREWTDWQREQLDKLINDLYAEINAEKDDVLLSCSAWGIYNRYNIEGYYGFSSGYHDYFQDTWNWIRLGAMDYLMPMIYWDMADPKPNYQEVVDDFISGIGAEHLVGGQSFYRRSGGQENIDEINYTRQAGAAGTVIFSFSSRRGGEALEKIKAEVYQQKVPLPEPTWKTNPETGIILGKVLDENGEPVLDAWVTLSGESTGRGRRSSRTWPTSADGRYAFLKVPSGPQKITVSFPGSDDVELTDVTVMAGEAKEINLTLPGAGEARSQVFFNIMRPDNNSETSGEVTHILGKTMPDNKIIVDNKEITVYETGAFAVDNLELAMGENHFPVTAVDSEGRTTTRVFSITRKEPESRERIATEFKLVEPAQNLAMLPGDVLQIEVSGPPNYSGYARCWKKVKIELNEVSEGKYQAGYRIPAGFEKDAAAIQIKMKPKKGKSMEAESKATVEVWNGTVPKVGRTTEERTGINFGTHSVRLGGPYLTEIPEGTKLEIIGQKGNNYKVKLSKSMTGWVSAGNVEMMPKGTPVPHAYTTYCGVSGDENYDKVSLSLGDSVAYAVSSETEPANFIYIDLFNTHYAMTWISHRTGSQILGPVLGEQMEEDWVRLKIPVKTKQIWGYWIEKTNNIIVLNIKRPPVIAESPDSPVKDLVFALEAGHGARNSGAVGLMGTKEKTVNLGAVEALKEVLESRGAKTVLVRPGDSYPSLSERVEAANAANADLFISVHANAAGTSRGFLRVSGTSTYFKDKHCYLLARDIYHELLKLDWPEFGIVGSFQYRPLRNTKMPSMLVEQAFMSNPYDEARLINPEYQKAQAEAIVRGVEKFILSVKE